MRTITVKGTGNVSVKPDYVKLSLSIEALDKSYERALEKANNQLKKLSDAIVSAGLQKDDLKTTSFDIEPRSKSVKKWNGNYEDVFQGYACTYGLSLSFNFDNTQLAKTIAALAQYEANPDFSIEFTVKNPAAVNEQLLIQATENAKTRAKILCQAAGCQLGQLQHIDYNWGELNLVSDIDCDAGSFRQVCCDAMPQITPDDIHVSDTVTFIWEIL